MWSRMIGLIVILAFGLLVAQLHAETQQTSKVPRIGFLDTSTASGIVGLVAAFWQEMDKHGWIEGKNITVEYRFAEQKNAHLPELAADLVRLKVDLSTWPEIFARFVPSPCDGGGRGWG